MKTFANIAVGVVAGSMVTWLVIHRHAVAAVLQGKPLPEPPAWHIGHACLKK